MYLLLRLAKLVAYNPSLSWEHPTMQGVALKRVGLGGLVLGCNLPSQL